MSNWRRKVNDYWMQFSGARDGKEFISYYENASINGNWDVMFFRMFCLWILLSSALFATSGIGGVITRIETNSLCLTVFVCLGITAMYYLVSCCIFKHEYLLVYKTDLKYFPRMLYLAGSAMWMVLIIMFVYYIAYYDMNISTELIYFIKNPWDTLYNDLLLIFTNNGKIEQAGVMYSYMKYIFDRWYILLVGLIVTVYVLFWKDYAVYRAAISCELPAQNEDDLKV